MPTEVRRRAPGAPPLASSRLRALGDRMLAALDLPGAELSVLLVNDAGIQRLNREHRGRDRPTDVLSFPLDGRRSALTHARRAQRRGACPVLGDVVVSLDTAARQAAGRRRPLLAEVRFLLAHGLLHLVGYDHATPEDKREMSAMARRLVRAASL